MNLTEMLADLPRACSTGVKQNAKGYRTHWIGYKLHLDVADGDIPISALVTSASLHDSQAALPLATMTAARVTSGNCCRRPSGWASSTTIVTGPGQQRRANRCARLAMFGT